MVFQKDATDAFGHKKLGGIGDLVSEELTALSPRFNNGKKIECINQKLGYLVRCGDPDAIDSIVPMAYGNLALDLLLNRIHGRLVVLKNGRYDNMPIETVTATKKFDAAREEGHGQARVGVEDAARPGPWQLRTSKPPQVRGKDTGCSLCCLATSL